MMLLYTYTPLFLPFGFGPLLPPPPPPQKKRGEKRKGGRGAHTNSPQNELKKRKENVITMNSPAVESVRAQVRIFFLTRRREMDKS